MKFHASVERYSCRTAKEMDAGDPPLPQILNEPFDQATADAATAKFGVDVHMQVRRKLPPEPAPDGLGKASLRASFQPQPLAGEAFAVSVAAITAANDLPQQ